MVLLGKAREFKDERKEKKEEEIFCRGIRLKIRGSDRIRRLNMIEFESLLTSVEMPFLLRFVMGVIKVEIFFYG